MVVGGHGFLPAQTLVASAALPHQNLDNLLMEPQGAEKQRLGRVIFLMARSGIFRVDNIPREISIWRVPDRDFVFMLQNFFA